MDRRLLSVGLVAIVLLSGCSTITGSPGTPTPLNPDSGESSNPTMPANHPDVNGSSGSGGEMPNDHPDVNGTDAGVADWTNKSTISEQRLLVRDHATLLLSSSYDVSARIDRSDANGQTNRSIEVASVPRESRLLSVRSDSNGTLTRYQNGSTLYVKDEAGGTSYRTRQVSADFMQVHQDAALLRSLQAILGHGNFTKVDEREDGLAEFRLENATRGGAGNFTIERATGHVVVDSDGLVHDASIEVRGDNAGSPVYYRIEYRVTQTGNVTIEPPSWLEDAKSAGN